MVVVLLNCKSMDDRWEEVKKLSEWAVFKKNQLKSNNKSSYGSGRGYDVDVQKIR